jgi:hypothetical protein
MDSDALLHPRGPLPPGVYWRRRLLTLLVLVIVLAVVWRACGSGGGTPSPQVSRTPAPSTSTSAPPRTSSSPSPSAGVTSAPAVAACPDTAIEVSAKADAQTYPPSRRPILTIGVANKGTVACTRDVGQAAREIRVFSGNDRVWSSDDCSPGGGSQVVTLKPGAAPVTFSVTWSRKRSAPGCPAGATDVPSGTYRVTGRFGDVVSASDTFTVTA